MCVCGGWTEAGGRDVQRVRRVVEVVVEGEGLGHGRDVGDLKSVQSQL